MTKISITVPAGAFGMVAGQSGTIYHILQATDADGKPVPTTMDIDPRDQNVFIQCGFASNRFFGSKV
jgi:hypothetical protein